jgi:hypothetical protein
MTDAEKPPVYDIRHPTSDIHSAFFNSLLI